MLFATIAHAMGAPAAGAAQPSGTDLMMQFVPFILILGVFWFLLIRPQQKRMKEHKALLENLKKGDYVVTSGGMIGRILELDADTVLLESEDSKFRMSRGAIGGLYNKSNAAGKVENKDS